MFKLTLHRIHRTLLSVLMLNLHILIVLVHLLPTEHSYSFNIHILYIYIYIRLKIKPNSVTIRSLSCQIFVLPSTEFELTPYIYVRLRSTFNPQIHV
jgi:hypothetical protein